MGLTVGVQEILAARQRREEKTHTASALGTYQHQTRLKVCKKAANKMQWPLSVL